MKWLLRSMGAADATSITVCSAWPELRDAADARTIETIGALARICKGRRIELVAELRSRNNEAVARREAGDLAIRMMYPSDTDIAAPQRPSPVIIGNQPAGY